MSEDKILYQIISHDSDYIKGIPDKVRTINGTTYHYYDFKNHRYLSCFISDDFNVYDEIARITKENAQLKEKLNCDLHWALKYDELHQENQQLKKQLENCYCNRTDCSSRIKDSKKYDSLAQKAEKQQKEFIKWLEEESKEVIRDAGYHQRICEDILEKYKEIVGSDK